MFETVQERKQGGLTDFPAVWGMAWSRVSQGSEMNPIMAESGGGERKAWRWGIERSYRLVNCILTQKERLQRTSRRLAYAIHCNTEPTGRWGWGEKRKWSLFIMLALKWCLIPKRQLNIDGSVPRWGYGTQDLDLGVISEETAGRATDWLKTPKEYA